MSRIIRVGNWRIHAAEGWIAGTGRMRQVRIRPDARLMAVFEVLLNRPGQVVGVDEILAHAWQGRVVSRDSVSSAIYELRQLLGDDAANPEYIRTEPRRGYRLIAPVTTERRPQSVRAAVTKLSLVIAIVGGLSWYAIATFVIEPPYLHVAPLEDATGDSRLAPISAAIDATLESALIARHPNRIVSWQPAPVGSLRLETQLVACDLGPALVAKLANPAGGQYLWSKSYPLDHAGTTPTLVDLVADDVTLALLEI